jgi:hypothetical protein
MIATARAAFSVARCSRAWSRRRDRPRNAFARGPGAADRDDTGRDGRQPDSPRAPVAIARDDAPQVHLIDGPDERRAETHNRAACLPRECRFTVSIFVRANDDETFALADPLIEDVLARLDPMTGGGYAYGNATANLKFLDVTPEPEPADGDALRVDLKFVMSYDTSGFGLSA